MTLGEPERVDGGASNAARVRHLSAGLRHLAQQRDLVGLATIAARTAVELVDADRGRCVFYDHANGTLWVEPAGGIGETKYEATEGITGLVARAGEPRAVECAREDPIYRREVDDPDGSGEEQLVAQPVTTPDGVTHGVLVLARKARTRRFTAGELDTLAQWATAAAPLFHAHALEQQAACLTVGVGTLFRARALHRHESGSDGLGETLYMSPRWTRWAPWLMLVFVAAIGTFAACSTVREYATGPALVVVSDQHEVATVEPGVLRTVAVAPGDVVARGTLLAELESEAERVEVDRAEHDYRRELENRLRDPADAGLARSVARLDIERARARARLERRRIHAPTDGIVGDVRATPGQALDLGDTVVTLGSPGGSPRIRAFVPGRYAPSLASGREMIVELDGFAHASLHLRVAAVGAQVLGPTEARRMLGPRLADSIPVGEPVVLVEGWLTGTEFVADDRRWTMYDGMTARAEVEVERERLLFVLFPRLKDALSNG